MVVEAERDVYIAWDAFLEAELERERIPVQEREKVLRQRKAGIEAFRRSEWVQIKHELARDYNYVVADELEPHWVEAGTAVYWQEQIVRQPVTKGQTQDGTPIRVWEDMNFGWKTTSPQPANNAGQIAGYLKRGFRFRPPRVTVAVEALQSAVPVSALQPPEPPKAARVFLCQRHDDRRVFPTWKAYVQHCAQRREPLEEEPPAGVLAAAKNYMYFCYVHHKGFNHKRLAMRHLKAELAKPGRAVHPTVEQMSTKIGG